MHTILKMLPDNALLSTKEVCSYTGLKRSQLDHRLRVGKIPVIPQPTLKQRALSNNGKMRIWWTAKFVRDNIVLFS